MQTSYIRKGNTITSTAKNEEGGPKEVLTFDSVNKAKKESRKMQMANGGLGGGYIMTLSENKEYKPKPKARKRFNSLLTELAQLSDTQVDELRKISVARAAKRNTRK